MKKDFVFEIYKSNKTVFTLKDVSLLLNINSLDQLKSKVHYYVKKGILTAIRRGIYVKPEYNIYELATRIYTPSYVTLETILQKEGIISQYYETIFAASYLSRNIIVDTHEISLRKIKYEILLNPAGILQKENYAVAEKERAVLDTLYLCKEYHFDNIYMLNKNKLFALAHIYKSKRLESKVKELFS